MRMLDKKLKLLQNETAKLEEIMMYWEMTLGCSGDGVSFSKRKEIITYGNDFSYKFLYLIPCLF